MSHLFSGHSLSKSFGKQILFDQVDLFINRGDRIGLLGPNGSGKSTLLKILCGLEETDTGTIQRKKHLRTGYLAQDDRLEEELSVMENILREFDGDERLDESEKHTLAHTILSLGEFTDSDIPVSSLSGGWRKRLSICKALVRPSDILAMDEPTNHLDMESILWLEKMLNDTGATAPAALVLVSHDRRFLENCTNRIVELSPSYPQGSLQVKGNYSGFLEEKQRFLNNQLELEQRLSNKAKREIQWLRRGPKARTTKARYRVDEAYRLQEELHSVRTRNRAATTANLDFDSSGRKTKKLLVASEITKHYSGKPLFTDLDITLSPGTRLGLLGRNGCGKSTLMTILASTAELNPAPIDSGTIRAADSVQIVHFDQKREKLNINQTVKRALAPEGDSIVYRGRSIHVVSWAKRFLFRVDQLESPVGNLSGGEQARILIASLMRRPADILLLDEPTNDLDIETLDVLQESLISFPGALVLATHDRYLIDSVCDRVLGFDSKGGVQYYGDYHQYLEALNKGKSTEKSKATREKAQVPKSEKRKSRGQRLSYLEQREYDMMEEKILEAEQKEQELQQLMDSPEAADDSELLHEYWQQLETVRETIETYYSRWSELEEKRAEGSI